MGFFNKVTGLFSLGLKGKCEDSILNKIVFINLICFAGIVMLALFSALAFYLGDFMRGILSAAVALIFAGGFYYIRKTHRYSTLAFFNTGIILVFLFYILISELNAEYYLYWLLIIPVISIPVFGSKRGVYISFFTLAASLIVILLTGTEGIAGENLYLVLTRYVGAYTGLLLISAALEYFHNSSLRLLEKQLIESRNEVKVKEGFISRLSHQIRTPLNNIMLIGNMANESNLTSEQKDMMETIMASAYNLLSAVENITELSFDNIKKEPTEKIGFNMYNTVSNTIKLFTYQESSDIEFNFAISKNLKNNQLIGDPVLVKQILINLIETIIKYKTPENLSIGIDIDATYDTDDYTDARFIISTDHPVSLPIGLTGLPDSQMVFPADDYAGFINISELAIAQKLISQSGGKLETSFTSEKSLVFDFSLPFRRSFSEKSEKVQSAPHTGKSIISHEKVELKDSAILLVEDNSINQKILMLSLNKVVKRIEVANNGKEALDKFGKSKFDIILMDIQMPLMDGIVATRKIREVEASLNTRTPIIAITANALHGDRETCLEAGMDDYISKPFNSEDLLLKMKKLL